MGNLFECKCESTDMDKLTIAQDGHQHTSLHMVVEDYEREAYFTLTAETALGLANALNAWVLEQGQGESNEDR